MVMIPDASLFVTSSHLSNTINCAVVRSEIEGGVHLQDLAEGSVVLIETQNRIYTLVNCGQGKALLRGHPELCPEPVLVRIHGSTWGGSTLKYRFIGRGMHLEFGHPKYELPIVTSLVVDVREQR
jgi:hypothetical protein